ncbi:hypothetical protein EX30DRAFT_347990 [Ascodesmis nigricans]|uniref:GPI anchored protein n=1 Tax=Ascodesmis nigricans TaxID=341454 RepID=A0A4S2MZM8_9PEZI|nr:hypothetical protein EX30DRAFT_347990 [Ascodesmis nigricans]
MQFSTALVPLVALLISQAVAEPRGRTLVGRRPQTLVGRAPIPTEEAEQIFSILPVSNDPDLPGAAPTSNGAVDGSVTILPISASDVPTTTEGILSILPISTPGEGIVDLDPSTSGGGLSNVTAYPGPEESGDAEGAAARNGFVGAVAVAAGLIAVIGLL